MRRAVRVVLALGTAIVLAALARATATAGVWGASGSPYLDGVICAQDGSSSPLASWDFGAGSPAFLLAPVTSAAGIDSAALPYPINGAPQFTPLTPGTDGFDAQDIADYAYLIGRFGHADTQSVAELAQAVMIKAGSPVVPACVDAAALPVATGLGGPYTLTVVTAASPVAMGTPTTLSVKVRSATGRPVPGLSVDFAATNATVSSAVARSDTNGVASTSVTIPPGTPGLSVPVRASLSAPLALEELTSAGNANTVGAIAVAAPVAVSAVTQLTIDPTAAPVIRASASHPAIALGQPFQEYASVTGLRGHSAAVRFSVYGPLPLTATGGCPTTTFVDSTPVAALTAAVTVLGDQRVTAADWTPAKPGCYSIVAAATTNDARPMVSALSVVGAAGSTVSVLPTTAKLTLAHSVLGVGPMQADIALTDTFGDPVTASVIATGPVPPTAGSCADADFSHVRSPISFTPVTSTSGGPVSLVSNSATAAGCYRLQPSVTLDSGELGVIPVPTTARTVLLVSPDLASTVGQVWAISPDPVKAIVDVEGLAGLSSHLSLQLAYAPPSPTGCLSVDWSHAALRSPGPAVLVTGDGQALPVRSGPTTAVGCYLPVARLVVDANPGIVVTTALADPANAVSVGVDPNQHARLGSPHGAGAPLISGQLMVVLVGFLELLAVGTGLRLAWTLRE